MSSFQFIDSDSESDLNACSLASSVEDCFISDEDAPIPPQGDEAQVKEGDCVNAFCNKEDCSSLYRMRYGER